MKLSRGVTLYHVTPTSRLASILREGLRPKLRRGGLLGRPAIYLGVTPSSAARWAMDLDEESQEMAWGEPMSILAVRLRRGRSVHFDPEGYSESFYVSRGVPPEDIRVVGSKRVGKLPEELEGVYDKKYWELLRSLPGHEEELEDI